MLQEGHTQKARARWGRRQCLHAACAGVSYALPAVAGILRPQHGHKLLYGMELPPCRGRLGELL